MTTRYNVAIGDIFTCITYGSLKFVKIVSFTPSGNPKYVVLNSTTKVSAKSNTITYKISDNLNQHSNKGTAFKKPQKDGLLRIDGSVLTRYDPLHDYTLGIPEFYFGSDDEGSSHSDFE